MANRYFGNVMHAKYFLDTEAIHQTVPNHCETAAFGLFSGLKDQDHGPVELSVVIQIPRRTQQHCRMAVVTAGMHFPSVLVA